MTAVAGGGPEAVLREGLRELNLTLDEGQMRQLLDYQALIGKWTRVYNLTAVRDPQEMMTHHLLDSLAAVPPLARHLAELKTLGNMRPTLLDVGAGAGLPGVVMAICCPELSVTCVDTVAKKAAFIRQAALELRLSNLTGLHARVENLAGPFDVVCSRAFATLGDFFGWSAGALAPQGVWLAMKGKHPANELAVLSSAIDVFHVEQLTVPGLDAERCIVWARRKGEKSS